MVSFDLETYLYVACGSTALLALTTFGASTPRIVHDITPAGSRVLLRDLGAACAGGCTCRAVVHDTRSSKLPNHRRLRQLPLARSRVQPFERVYVACLNLHSYMRFARSRPLP